MLITEMCERDTDPMRSRNRLWRALGRLAAVKSEVSQHDFFLLVPCHMHMGPKADQEMHMHILYSACTVCTSIVLWL